MRARALLLALAVSLLPLSVAAAPLRVGDQAPDFSLVDQNGKPVRLSDFHGTSTVVIAFYVMAFTPG
jgi:thioredoxin-dependent peroxiredoxin